MLEIKERSKTYSTQTLIKRKLRVPAIGPLHSLCPLPRSLIMKIPMANHLTPLKSSPKYHLSEDNSGHPFVKKWKPNHHLPLSTVIFSIHLPYSIVIFYRADHHLTYYLLIYYDDCLLFVSPHRT